MLSGYKTLAGAIIAAIPTVATFFGYDTSPNFMGEATEMLAALITLIGAALAFYGRLVATVPGWFARRSPTV